MITRLDIKIKPQNKEIKNLYGNLFQGYLMSLIDSDYAQFLHKNQLNPYSQFVFYNKEDDCYIWRISALTEEAHENITKKILNKKEKTLTLTHNDLTFDIISKGITQQLSYKDISDKYFSAEKVKRLIKIRTLTPVTYKSNNEYQIFPEVKSLYVSLYNKWCAFSTNVSIESEETLEHLINHTNLDSYDLKSAKYSTDGINIKAFKGNFSIYIKGPEPLVNIANMLFDYAQYCGLGAKTSMGMGGVKVE